MLIIRRHIGRLALVGLSMAASCGGGGGGSGGGGGETSGSFRLVQFLEQGQNGIPRNRVLTFVFSAPVAPAQDFSERLKIQNTQGNPGSNFSLATGTYETVGDRVTFNPRLPNKEDRSDAGFRENGDYTVFLKAGPDALRSVAGDPISVPQELLFETSEFFEDPSPAQPPRVKGLWARDTTQVPTAPRFDVSRLDPRPGEQAVLDNATLIGAERVIDPGAGGGPDYGTPWRFELELTEPVDPLTVTTDTIQMFEIRSDATTSGDAAPPFAPDGYFGTPVTFKVPISVSLEQQILPGGAYDVKIVVQPRVTLVDNTRYRLTFAGAIIGIDFRQQFIGVNGLTGDGETVVSGTTPYPEPGGLGYIAELIVRDRPVITAKRTLTYNPIEDGIRAEVGQTSNDVAKFNTALYNPASSPGKAVGYLGAFGTGKDGNLAVASGLIHTIDTGDTPNPPLGRPFQVFDLNPNDDYLNNTLPGGLRTYDSRQPFELHLQSLTVSTGAVLRFVGVNPALLRVQGISQIAGTIDVSGAKGDDSPGKSVANGGKAGPGGGDGGTSRSGSSCSYLGIYQNCAASTFNLVLTSCGTANWPYSVNGAGPGRGQAGGSMAGYIYYSPPSAGANSGTGGGGGSHGTAGTSGSDIVSATAPAGTGGNCFAPSYYTTQNSGVVGVRGRPGTVYGDPTVADITWGGSGGGAGGATGNYSSFSTNGPGGAGGGAGGSLTVIGAGSIIATGGLINASGGAGGAGAQRVYTSIPQNYFTLSGGGGGASGGTICLISGENIALTASVLDTAGGLGGAAPSLQSGTCTHCNTGGNGGKGIIFLMDPDGLVSGLFPNGAGTYPTFVGGYLTISTFTTAGDRFGETHAVTELFNIPAANPTYLEFDGGTDILATVNNATQQILLYASSAKGDTDDPLEPNIFTEIPEVLVARVHYQNGATQVDVSFDAMDQLNPTGPNRDAYVRIDAFFDYGNLVEAALGPFAYMDRVDINYSFNG
ncbi:MAG: hypothetical protein L6Q95_11880 [Planctomycetes bacterium]|nr:hypothetical protein [Planctomycetota bacterium]